MNMTFSSLALCSPSSVVICLLDQSREGKGKKYRQTKKNASRRRERDRDCLKFTLVIGKKEGLVFL